MLVNREAADEGRLGPNGNTIVGPVIVNQGEVMRPSQLIASVGPTLKHAKDDDGGEA